MSSQNSQMEAFNEDAHDKCHQVEDNSFWFRQRNTLIIYLIKKNLNKGRFADVGGGNGYVAVNLKRINPSLDIILIEPGEKGCINARKRGLTEVYNMHIQEYVEFGQLDGIGLFDVIEHIEEPIKFLKDCSKKLHDNGKIFLTLPAYSFLWSYDDEVGGHYKRYSIKMIRQEAKEAGLEITFASYFFISLIPIIFFMRRIPYMIRIKKIDTQSDHKETFFSRMIERMLGLEFQLFHKTGVKLPIGASIIAILEKTK